MNKYIYIYIIYYQLKVVSMVIMKSKSKETSIDIILNEVKVATYGDPNLGCNFEKTEGMIPKILL